MSARGAAGIALPTGEARRVRVLVGACASYAEVVATASHLLGPARVVAETCSKPTGPGASMSLRKLTRAEQVDVALVRLAEAKSPEWRHR